MGWPDIQVEQVIGPRLEREAVVVETLTPLGQVALRMSAAAAADLSPALSVAFGRCVPKPPASGASERGRAAPSRKRSLRKLFKNSVKTRSAD